MSDAKVAKLFELEGIAPEAVVAGVRHLRAQGQKVDVADVVQKHAGYIRAKTLQMLEADPSILEDALKAGTTPSAAIRPHRHPRLHLAGVQIPHQQGQNRLHGIHLKKSRKAGNKHRNFQQQI